MRKALVGVLAALVLLPTANASPGAAAGAVVLGTGAAIICDHAVRSYMETTPESDEAFAVGLAVETAVVGTSATALGAGTIIVVGKGLHLAGRALAPRATSHAARYARTARRHAERWMGQIKFGDVRPPSDPIRWNLPRLYAKQRGMDGICTKVPLPPLYVGPVWKRRFNTQVHVDHWFPQSKGGTDVFSNLRAALGKFNQQNGVLTGYELRSAKRKFCPV